MASSSKRSRIAAAIVLLVLIGFLRGGGWHPLDLFVHPLVRLPAASVVWEGDSQSAAAAGVVTTADVAMQQLDEVAYARTFATGGAVLDTLIARAPAVDAALVDFPGTRNVLVAWAGSNDLGFGADPAAVHQKYRDYAAARRQAGWTVVVLTALPRSFATDVPGYEQRRQAFNELVRSSWQGYADLFVDVGADPEIGAPGAQDDPAFYAPDLAHLNDEGRTRAAELVATAFSRLGID